MSLLLLLDEIVEASPKPKPSPVATSTADIVRNPFSYYAYDFKTGMPLAQLPLQKVKFGQQLNTAQQLTASIDLMDPRVRGTNPIAATIPNKSLIVVDYEGAVVWAGVVLPRNRSNPPTPVEITCSEIWAYFEQSRAQATDYSAPPFSGISGEKAMPYWTATPWDASLICVQLLSDALSVPYGDPLGGLGILLNGETPSGSKPVAPEADWVAVQYPYASVQMVGTIVTQLSQLGLGAGPDFGIDVAYSSGPGSPLVGTINLSYPRRGRTVSENNLSIDLTLARNYKIPEDGTQTANQVFEIGGSGAIVVAENINPLEQGYLLWERVISHATAQSQHITSLLSQFGTSDLAMYSYAPVAPKVTLSAFDPNLPVGSFVVGDDVQLVMPELGEDGDVFDPGFPAGLDQEWRITSWTVTVEDKGQALNELALAQPPYLEALSPAV